MSKRVPNFTCGEKARLLNLIANKYAAIIEDKKTDRSSVLLKENAWKCIEDEFNSSNDMNIFRNASSLKKFYENRKKGIRKTLAEERKETLLTGGGPPAKISRDESDELLMSIINNKTLVGLSNPFDDDAVDAAVNIENFPPNREIEYVFENNELLEESEVSVSAAPSADDVQLANIGATTSADCFASATTTGDNWKKYTPLKLKQPINPSLNTESTKKPINRRRPATLVKPLASSNIAKKYNILLDKRLELVEEQIRHTKEHNELIMKKIKMENELLEIQLRAAKK